MGKLQNKNKSERGKKTTFNNPILLHRIFYEMVINFFLYKFQSSSAPYTFVPISQCQYCFVNKAANIIHCTDCGVCVRGMVLNSKKIHYSSTKQTLLP